jgi:UDP-N-acetylmuramate dehydrogenase
LVTSALDVAAQRLRAAVRGQVERHRPLAPDTTYGIGGPADLAILPEDGADLVRAVRTLGELGLGWLVLGGGSNVLVSDRGVRGAVILTHALDSVAVEGSRLRAGAGVTSHQVAVTARDAGLQGAEFLAWLPGSIGGACLMNARAFGGEISGVLERARVVDAAGQLDELRLRPDDFSYKRSPFQESGTIIVEAVLGLEPGDPARIQQRMDEIEARRRARHEMDVRSCGCVFKNDYSLGRSSGQIIDACGLKQVRVGDAQVSPHHANFVLNLGQATAADVRRVIEIVRARVEQQMGHRLELEVRLVGEWE